MSSAVRSGAQERPPLQLEGTCQHAGCTEQHLHRVTGVPPDYHWRANDGTPLPRWSEPSFRRRAVDPRDWWYRLDEIARACGVCWKTVRRWIRRGGLRASRAPGGRIFLVKGSDLDEFLRVTDRVYPKPENRP